MNVGAAGFCCPFMFIRDDDMRIKIENVKEFDALRDAFKGYVIYGYIQNGVDGVFFVVDKVEVQR